MGPPPGARNALEIYATAWYFFCKKLSFFFKQQQQICLITLSARSELRLDSYIHMVLCTRTHEDPRVYKRGKSCLISLSQDPGKRLVVSATEEDWRSFSPPVQLAQLCF